MGEIGLLSPVSLRLETGIITPTTTLKDCSPTGNISEAALGRGALQRLWQGPDKTTLLWAGTPKGYDLPVGAQIMRRNGQGVISDMMTSFHVMILLEITWILFY